jgi:ribosomal protein S24E
MLKHDNEQFVAELTELIEKHLGNSPQKVMQVMSLRTNSGDKYSTVNCLLFSDSSEALAIAKERLAAPVYGPRYESELSQSGQGQRRPSNFPINGFPDYPDRS